MNTQTMPLNVPLQKNYTSPKQKYSILSLGSILFIPWLIVVNGFAKAEYLIIVFELHIGTPTGYEPLS